MAIAAEGIVDFLIDTVDGVDAEALEANAAAYIAELEALDAEVEETLAVIPEERRLLVTNHDTFGYFADRYDFEVLGTIIPGGSTLASVSARDLSELASTIAELGVPAVFAETTVSSQLADTLAAEVGDVEVVELFTDSVGAPDSEGATYVAMVRTNAERIAAALGG
jgi:zinc/manganese transport system substrate-binding protein